MLLRHPRVARLSARSRKIPTARVPAHLTVTIPRPHVDRSGTRGRAEPPNHLWKTAERRSIPLTMTSAARAMHDRAAVPGGASDPTAARPLDDRTAVLGQGCHSPVEPLDLPPQGVVHHAQPLETPPQGFELLGLPPPFRLALCGQPPQGRRQLPFQLGQTAPSLSRQLYGRLLAPGPARIGLVARKARSCRDVTIGTHPEGAYYA